MTDPLSIENGAIMSNASRWSLMIDPQLQGIKWIMNRELPNGLKIIQQSQAKYIDTVSPQSCLLLHVAIVVSVNGDVSYFGHMSRYCKVECHAHTVRNE